MNDERPTSASRHWPPLIACTIVLAGATITAVHAQVSNASQTFELVWQYETGG